MPADQDRIEEHVQALETFRDAYIAYLQSEDEGGEQRIEVVRATPAAQAALDTVGGGLMVQDPPAAGGRLTYHGLENLAFLHERPGFGMSEPPLYEAVVESVERGIAQLQYRAQNLARAGHDQPVFCRRGHLLGRTVEASPAYCGECGAAALAGCERCNARVAVRPADPDTPASFCVECGTPYPWVDRQGRIYRLENMLADENLDEASELAVREQLEALVDPELPVEEQRRRWLRVKEAAPGLFARGGNIIEGLAAAAIRQQLGL